MYSPRVIRFLFTNRALTVEMCEQHYEWSFFAPSPPPRPPTVVTLVTILCTNFALCELCVCLFTTPTPSPTQPQQSNRNRSNRPALVGILISTPAGESLDLLWYRSVAVACLSS